MLEAWKHVKYNYDLRGSFIETLLRFFPRLEEVSVAFLQHEMAAFVASFNRWGPSDIQSTHACWKHWQDSSQTAQGYQKR